jgi:small conductance mechanosensitive channel
MKTSVLNSLAMALLAALLTHPLAAAEPSPDSATLSPVEETRPADANQEKIQGIREKIAAQTKALGLLKDEITQLNADVEKAQNEERAVLRDQRRRKHEEARIGLERLVKGINELESAGQDTREAREGAAAHARQVSAWLKVDINDSLKVLALLDEQVKAASATDAPEIRQQIANERRAVDEALAALLDNSERMQLLGLDNAPDLKYLDDTLAQRADNLVARLQYLVQQRDGLSKQVAGAGEEEKKRLKEKVSSLDGRVLETADNLKITIDLMNERKLDAAEYKQILISSTGEITKDIFESDVALGLLNQWLDGGKEWLIDQGPQWVFKLVMFVLILMVFSALGNMVKRLAGRALASSRLRASKLLQDLFVSMAGKAIFLIGLLIALAQVGVQIGPVLAGLGIVGFIIGFALQETLSNFASGVMILIYRPFDVGDAIEAGGVSGKVKQMSLVSTTITTFDNQRVIVPNKKIWGDVIRNMNAEDKRRVDLIFGIGYDDDIELADKVLHEIVDNYELALDDPAPVIRLHTLGESSVDFIVRPWVKTSDYWTAYWDITRAVKKRFDEEGISIPFPQQDMHIYHHGDGPSKSAL